MVSRILIAFILPLILLVAPGTAAAEESLTVTELAQFDGKDGRPAYFAYEGVVYDVTGSPTWKLGNHFGLQAGQDLTGQMDGAPHGIEVFVGLKQVGTLEGATPISSPVDAGAESPIANVESKATSQQEPQPWYAGRIKLLNISILGWTGILLAIFFVLTFATCFAMPWAKLPLPWKGRRIGPDPLDVAPNHMTWSSIHKHFVWWVVIFGLVHGVLGFLQMLGIYV